MFAGLIKVVQFTGRSVCIIMGHAHIRNAARCAIVVIDDSVIRLGHGKLPIAIRVQRISTKIMVKIAIYEISFIISRLSLYQWWRKLQIYSRLLIYHTYQFQVFQSYPLSIP